jgi:hypothetical protein
MVANKEGVLLKLIYDVLHSRVEATVTARQQTVKSHQLQNMYNAYKVVSKLCRDLINKKK